jgi:hypothetical protein
LLIFTARRAHFPAQERAFPPWWLLGGCRAAHNPTVVIPFSHSDDWVSSPVRDHSGLARIPLRTNPSVLPRSVYFKKGGQMQWTRSRNRPCSQTPTELVRESGPRIRPPWQKSRLINPRGQCTWQKCSDAAFAVPFLLIFTARRAHFPAQERAFPPWWPFWSYWAVHNRTVAIAFSHSADDPRAKCCRLPVATGS